MEVPDNIWYFHELGRDPVMLVEKVFFKIKHYEPNQDTGWTALWANECHFAKI